MYEAPRHIVRSIPLVNRVRSLNLVGIRIRDIIIGHKIYYNNDTHLPTILAMLFYYLLFKANHFNTLHWYTCTHINGLSSHKGLLVSLERSLALMQMGYQRLVLVQWVPK